MATNPTAPHLTTTQVDTNPLAPPGAAAAATLYPPQGPAPSGTLPESEAQIEREEAAAPSSESAPGIEGEEVVWEARYSMRNFIGRITLRALLTIAWGALAVWTWNYHHGETMGLLTGFLGVVLLVVWAALIYRIILARFGHFYSLTNRRLFISSGLLVRRRDQLELLKIEDIYTRQTLIERWLSLGTVVVVSSEKTLPTAYLTGVDDPKRVMDLIWHYARKERDERSVKVQSV